jgi:hypothetical protein
MPLFRRSASIHRQGGLRSEFWADSNASRKSRQTPCILVRLSHFMVLERRSLGRTSMNDYMSVGGEEDEGEDDPDLEDGNNSQEGGEDEDTSD